MVFGDVLEIKNGKNQRSFENPDGKYPIYGSGGIIGYANDFICCSEPGKVCTAGQPLCQRLDTPLGGGIKGLAAAKNAGVIFRNQLLFRIFQILMLHRFLRVSLFSIL